MHNILITGSNGQLGQEIKELSSSYEYNFYFTDKQELDIRDKNDIENFINQNKIDLIINCAAYTNVDKAEEDLSLANEINHIAVKNLAQVSKNNNIKLIHISTDYVFNGVHHIPYTEEDNSSPINVYGKTKYDGEMALIEEELKDAVIIRTSWLYSSFHKNFVKTMLQLGSKRDSLNVIFDQIGTPTYARDLAKVILDIVPKIKNEKVEIYHYSNEGVASWYDFAKEIMDMKNIECSVFPIETKDYPTPAKRPHYSLLNKEKIKSDFALVIPHWKESLKECLLKIGDNY